MCSNEKLFLKTLSFRFIVLFIFLQAGAEAGVSNPQFKNIKQVFRVMAILMIPLTAKFPAVRFT